MNEYRTVEVNGVKLILDENMAINLYHDLAREFNWLGTFFTPNDVAVAINYRYEKYGLELLSDDKLSTAVSAVTDDGEWGTWLPDWMNERGWGIIESVISENLESEFGGVE